MRDYLLNEIALRIHHLSSEVWGKEKALVLIGQHPKILDVQRKLVKYAQSELPLLITGECGVGKEIFAQSHYILGRRSGKPFISLNCAQYQDENLLVSELFGHKKGSFTGALTDHAGIFEKYNNGVIFLDEVGELSLKAQGMLLRVLAEGEIKPLGETATRSIDVQIIAATNRCLKQQIAEGSFREDLYYRLCRLHLKIPPLRERGNDWKLILNYHLSRLNQEFERNTRFSSEALSLLANYHWQGNIRELINIVSTGFFLSEDGVILPDDIANELHLPGTPARQDNPAEEMFASVPAYTDILPASHNGVPPAPHREYFQRIKQGEDFWEAIHKPFLDRELNRAQVRAIVKTGLDEAGGSYKKLLNVFNLSESHYLKFMDFLRHHRLKPNRT